MTTNPKSEFFAKISQMYNKSLKIPAAYYTITNHNDILVGFLNTNKIYASFVNFTNSRRLREPEVGYDFVTSSEVKNNL